MIKNIGLILLAVYLLMLSVMHSIPGIVLGIVAGAAAIFILVRR